MAKKPLVSIVIVNYNGGVIYKKCLESIKKIKYSPIEVIIVDNASLDGSQNYKLHSEKLKVKYIKNNINLGFVGGNNIGYENCKGKYILLLNNDTEVTPNVIDYLVSQMEKDPRVGVSQPKIKIMDNTSLLDNSGTYLTPIGFLEHWGYMQKDGKEFSTESYIFSAKGACMMIKREVIEKIGLFDQDFMSYFEESDFCWRAWISGYTVKYYPDQYIFHKVGYTSKRLSQVEVNYHSLKNRICSMIKNLNSINLVKILGFHLVILFGLCLYALVKAQFTKSKMYFDAIIWNIVNIGKTLNKRKQVQKIRTKKDDEIFSYIMHNVKWSNMIKHFQKVEANFK